MKALLSKEPGGPQTLKVEDRPRPEPGPGQVRIKVAACGLNYPDVLIIEDKYQMKPPRPFAPGGEVAGRVSGIGEGTERFSEGERVVAVCGFGGLAEEVCVDQNMVFHLPDDFSMTEAAGLLFTYATSIHALQDRGRLKEGETLLVLGAAGGIGLSCVEIGKAMGARVVAAVSSEGKAKAAKASGADVTVIYGEAPADKDASKALAAKFKDAVGRDGADVVVDPVGGAYAEPALRAIAWEGRYLVIGFPAGIPQIPLNLPLLKSCDICGVFWGAFAQRDPDANRRHVNRLMIWWHEEAIRPRVMRTWPLEKGGEAIAFMDGRGAIGKLVVEVAADRKA